MCELQPIHWTVLILALVPSAPWSRIGLIRFTLDRGGPEVRAGSHGKRLVVTDIDRRRIGNSRRRHLSGCFAGIWLTIKNPQNLGVTRSPTRGHPLKDGGGPMAQTAKTHAENPQFIQ